MTTLWSEIKGITHLRKTEHQVLVLKKFVLNTLESTPINRRNRNCKQNVNQQQRTAIKLLSEDKFIVIKEAYKGGAIVIMDTKHYKTMEYEILSNSESHELLEKTQAKQRLYLTETDTDKKHKRTLTEKESERLLTTI